MGVWLATEIINGVDNDSTNDNDNDNDNDKDKYLLPKLYRAKHLLNTIHDIITHLTNEEANSGTTTLVTREVVTYVPQVHFHNTMTS